MTSYTKPHLTYREQVDLLRQRGMTIDDPQHIEEMLSKIGYYRLSGYWYPFRCFDGQKRTDRFLDGTTFDQVLALYDLDRRLKLLVLDAVERIEIVMRVRVGYTLGKRHPYAHLDPKYLDGRFTRSQGSGKPSKHATWIKRVTEAQNRSTEDFVQHFRDRYDGRLPVWVATEIMDFGLLSYLYEGAMRNDRDSIARGLNILDSRGNGNGAALHNWMRVLNYLRNVCAHHSRLWNRNMTVQLAPKHLKPIRLLSHIVSAESNTVDRVYGGLCVLGFLTRQIVPEAQWCEELRATVELGLKSTERNSKEMGFPGDWVEQLLWSA